MRLFLFLFIWLFTILTFAQAPVVHAYTADLAYSQGLQTINTSRAIKYGVVASVTNSTPSAGTFTCAITDICTKAAHTFQLGLKVQFTTTNTLPAGLSLATDYFIIPIDANTFYIADSLVHAQAGTHVDITSTGTGVHTVTATSLAGASLKLRCSGDASAFADIPIRATGDASKSGTITTTANYYLTEDQVSCNYIQVYYTLTAGQLSISQVATVRTELKY